MKRSHISILLLCLAVPLLAGDRYWEPKHHYYRKYAKFEHLAGSVNAVLRVRIDHKVERGERHILTTGQPGRVKAEHTEYRATVVETLFGNWGKRHARISFRYTFKIPYDYDRQGNHTRRYTPTVTGSGIEDDLMVGETYVACFTSAQPGEMNQLTRAARSFQQQTIVNAVKRAHAKRAQAPVRRY